MSKENTKNPNESNNYVNQPQDEEEDLLWGGLQKRRKRQQREDCPYLDTIERYMLDFDLEKQCSQTLSTLNVYACLVCGKYFQGRGVSSPAQRHALQDGHHVFINLEDARVYCLPDNYEVNDRSIDDIKYAVNPTYTEDMVKRLDTHISWGRTIEGVEYTQGIVGLNNLAHSDYMNVIFQSFARVRPLREFFLLEKFYSLVSEKDSIGVYFGRLLRKIWSVGLFKRQVSPQELIQTIVATSKGRFSPTVQSDPIEFAIFLLNALHIALGGSKRSGSSIIHNIFQGELEITTHSKSETGGTKRTASQQPFLYLSLDVPPPPLFKSESEKNIIPQIPISVLLAKYDGITKTYDSVTGDYRQFLIKKLPKYLIIHIKRFARNQYFLEKNPTIVNFLCDNLDMSNCIDPQDAIEMDILKKSYELLANIKHEGNEKVEKGFYKNRAEGNWYEIQDLIVKETRPEFIVLSESYIQIYERKDVSVNDSRK